tara:strand:+ start:1801 stop:1953 length:153 start_codon:yes stop_codon:yes gene_type:complete
MEIKYLDHPCSTADKKEWNDKGFKVLDSRLAPVEQEKPKVKRKQKVKKKD